MHFLDLYKKASNLLKNKIIVYGMTIGFAVIYILILQLPYFNIAEGRPYSLLLFLFIGILWSLNLPVKSIVRIAVIFIILSFFGNIFHVNILYEDMGVLLYVILIYLVMRYLYKKLFLKYEEEKK